MPKKEWWNPIRWLEMIGEFVFGILKGIWDAIKSVCGFHPTAQTGRHENITAENVDAAADSEVNKQLLADMLDKQRTPAEVVHAYASAGAMDRPTVDLSALSPDQQDWLVGLSDADYILLSASGMPACERSLSAGMVIPSLTRLRTEKAAEEAPQPIIQQTKEEMIRERYLASIRGERQHTLTA